MKHRTIEYLSTGIIIALIISSVVSYQLIYAKVPLGNNRARHRESTDGDIAILRLVFLRFEFGKPCSVGELVGYTQSHGNLYGYPSPMLNTICD